MRPTIMVRTILAVMILVAVVGMVDAARGSSWDLVAVFGLLALLTIYLLVRTTVRRPLVPLRGDLVRWMADRTAVTGERIEDLADRAVSAYRAGLVGDDDSDSGDGVG